MEEIQRQGPGGEKGVFIRPHIPDPWPSVCALPGRAMSTQQGPMSPLSLCAIFAVAIVLWACPFACACEHYYDLKKADSILQIFDHGDGARAVDPIMTIKERDLREALDECVKGDLHGLTACSVGLFSTAAVLLHGSLRISLHYYSLRPLS